MAMGPAGQGPAGTDRMSQETVIIGAGPAGLAAALELSADGQDVTVIEKDHVVGGLARTVEYKGFRCDIGGHRFFTKSDYVDALWRQLLQDRFLRRPRLSRIYYDGKFFTYPLKVSNVLRNLGVARSASVVASLIAAKCRRNNRDDTFQDWVSNRFGGKLFEMFFRTYTEKIWGMPCSELSADWAAQRIQDLSAAKAILGAIGIGGKRSVASLIEEFDYPRLGPGQMYQEMADRAVAAGARLLLNRRACQVRHTDGRVVAVASQAVGPQALFEPGPGSRRRAQAAGGRQEHPVGGACFSSMPLDELVLALDPPPPAEALGAAGRLSYRSIITVNLLIDRPEVVPDTWIYIHDPRVRAGRMQFYGNWSPDMVPDPGKSVIGMEYFCTEGDQLWGMSDGELHDLAMGDLEAIGLADPRAVFDSFCARYAKAYPVYRREGYREDLMVIRRHLATLANLYPVGRYGQFRYNNMDHSILTAHYSVLKMRGQDVDPWAVNVEEEHLEERRR